MLRTSKGPSLAAACAQSRGGASASRTARVFALGNPPLEAALPEGGKGDDDPAAGGGLGEPSEKPNTGLSPHEKTV